MLDKIISSCPMIETMRLQRCRGLADIKVNGLHNLKDLYIDDYFSDTSSIEIDDPSTLETVKILYGNIVWFRKADFCNLNYLSLHGVSSSFEHFSSCKFPNLKTLILNSCDGVKQSSHLFINAPSILYFEYNYELGFMPSISFAKTSNEWESHIRVPYWPSSSLHGLFDIIQLLESLSQSKIFLTLSRCCSKVRQLDRFRVAYNGGCNKPVVVESLKLTYCEKFSYFSSLVLDIFRTCRPRNIYLYHVRKSDMVYLCKSLLKQGESGTRDRFRRWWNQDLEEVSVEIYDEYNGWQPITLSGSVFRTCHEWEHISPRFSLKWREA